MKWVKLKWFYDTINYILYQLYNIEINSELINCPNFINGKSLFKFFGP